MVANKKKNSDSRDLKKSTKQDPSTIRSTPEQSERQFPSKTQKRDAR